MTEAYIHFIWKLKRLPFHHLQTTAGKEIHILNNGIHNVSESGPDFFNARMLYENMEWAGQIEMHVKSSDWYRHGHQVDNAYNNVILHVVYEHDQDVFVNGIALPTVELKNLIDREHYGQWAKFANAMKDIPCEDSIQTIDSVFLKTMIHRAVTDRFNRKINQMLYLYDHLDHQSVLYHLLARAFGTKVNAEPFELLTNELPLVILKRLTGTMQKRLLLQTSGLYSINEIGQETVPIETNKLPSSLWKRKGLRPHSFPEKRIVQFSEFIASFDFELLTEYLSPKGAYKYIEALAEHMKKEGTFLSEQLLNQLLINAFLPYFWFKSIRNEDEQLQEFILLLMEELPPESNYVLKKWNKIGVKARNAYESQALIELYNEYCSHKKCLNCQVGVKILKGKEENM